MGQAGLSGPCGAAGLPPAWFRFCQFSSSVTAGQGPAWKAREGPTEGSTRTRGLRAQAPRGARWAGQAPAASAHARRGTCPTRHCPTQILGKVSGAGAQRDSHRWQPLGTCAHPASPAPGDTHLPHCSRALSWVSPRGLKSHRSTVKGGCPQEAPSGRVDNQTRGHLSSGRASCCSHPA